MRRNDPDFMNGRSGLLPAVALLCALGGCASTPPTSDELMRRFAADRAADAPIEADSPEDAAAMARAGAEVRGHLAARPALPASTGPDTPYEMTVTAAHGMAGNWHIVSPTSISVHSGAPDSWGKVRDFLCRFEQDGESLSGSCLPMRRSVRGSLRGDELHLGWNAGLIHADIGGRLLGPTDFAGEVAIGPLGLDLVGAHVPAYGSKISALPPAPDGADAEARTRFADLAGLRGFSYLGTVSLPADPESGKPAAAMLVYDVEFERSWQLCGFTAGEAELECR